MKFPSFGRRKPSGISLTNDLTAVMTFVFLSVTAAGIRLQDPFDEEGQVAVRVVQGSTARLSCDTFPLYTNDSSRLVLWYHKDSSRPLMSYDSRRKSRKWRTVRHADIEQTKPDAFQSKNIKIPSWLKIKRKSDTKQSSWRIFRRPNDIKNLKYPVPDEDTVVRTLPRLKIEGGSVNRSEMHSEPKRCLQMRSRWGCEEASGRSSRSARAERQQRKPLQNFLAKPLHDLKSSLFIKCVNFHIPSFRGRTLFRLKCERLHFLLGYLNRCFMLRSSDRLISYPLHHHNPLSLIPWASNPFSSNPRHYNSFHSSLYHSSPFSLKSFISRSFPSKPFISNPFPSNLSASSPPSDNPVNPPNAFLSSPSDRNPSSPHLSLTQNLLQNTLSDTRLHLPNSSLLRRLRRSVSHTSLKKSEGTPHEPPRHAPLSAPHITLKKSEDSPHDTVRHALEREGTVLVVKDVRAEDRGSYRCVTHYRASPVVSRRFKLYVHHGGEQAVALLYKSGEAVGSEMKPYSEGTHLSLTCRALAAGGKVEKLAWFLEGQLLPSSWSRPRPQLVLSRLQLVLQANQDGAQLTCRVYMRTKTRRKILHDSHEILEWENKTLFHEPSWRQEDHGKFQKNDRNLIEQQYSGEGPVMRNATRYERGANDGTMTRYERGTNDGTRTRYELGTNNGTGTNYERGKHDATYLKPRHKNVKNSKFQQMVIVDASTRLNVLGVPKSVLQVQGSTEGKNTLVDEGTELVLHCLVSSKPPPYRVIFFLNGRVVNKQNIDVKDAKTSRFLKRSQASVAARLKRIKIKGISHENSTFVQYFDAQHQAHSEVEKLRHENRVSSQTDEANKTTSVSKEIPKESRSGIETNAIKNHHERLSFEENQKGGVFLSRNQKFHRAHNSVQRQENTQEPQKTDDIETIAIEDHGSNLRRFQSVLEKFITSKLKEKETKHDVPTRTRDIIAQEVRDRSTDRKVLRVTFEVQKVTTGDGGLYTCVTSNSEGDGQSNAVLVTVTHPPRCSAFTPQRVKASPHTLLHCPMVANPPPTGYIWVRTRRALFYSQTPNVTLDDSLEFSNTVGSGDFNFSTANSASFSLESERNINENAVFNGGSKDANDVYRESSSEQTDKNGKRMSSDQDANASIIATTSGPNLQLSFKMILSLQEKLTNINNRNSYVRQENWQEGAGVRNDGKKYVFKRSDTKARRRIKFSFDGSYDTGNKTQENKNNDKSFVKLALRDTVFEQISERRKKRTAGKFSGRGGLEFADEKKLQETEKTNKRGGSFPLDNAFYKNNTEVHSSFDEMESFFDGWRNLGRRYVPKTAPNCALQRYARSVRRYALSSSASRKHVYLRKFDFKKLGQKSDDGRKFDPRKLTSKFDDKQKFDSDREFNDGEKNGDGEIFENEPKSDEVSFADGKKFDAQKFYEGKETLEARADSVEIACYAINSRGFSHTPCYFVVQVTGSDATSAPGCSQEISNSFPTLQQRPTTPLPLLPYSKPSTEPSLPSFPPSKPPMQSSLPSLPPTKPPTQSSSSSFLPSEPPIQFSSPSFLPSEPSVQLSSPSFSLSNPQFPSSKPQLVPTQSSQFPSTPLSQFPSSSPQLPHTTPKFLSSLLVSSAVVTAAVVVACGAILRLSRCHRHNQRAAQAAEVTTYHVDGGVPNSGGENGYQRMCVMEDTTLDQRFVGSSSESAVLSATSTFDQDVKCLIKPLRNEGEFFVGRLTGQCSAAQVEALIGGREVQRNFDFRMQELESFCCEDQIPPSRQKGMVSRRVVCSADTRNFDSCEDIRERAKIQLDDPDNLLPTQTQTNALRFDGSESDNSEIKKYSDSDKLVQCCDTILFKNSVTITADCDPGQSSFMRSLGDLKRNEEAPGMHPEDVSLTAPIDGNDLDDMSCDISHIPCLDEMNGANNETSGFNIKSTANPYCKSCMVGEFRISVENEFGVNESRPYFKNGLSSCRNSNCESDCYEEEDDGRCYISGSEMNSCFNGNNPTKSRLTRDTYTACCDKTCAIEDQLIKKTQSVFERDNCDFQEHYNQGENENSEKMFSRSNNCLKNDLSNSAYVERIFAAADTEGKLCAESALLFSPAGRRKAAAATAAGISDLDSNKKT